MQRTQNENALLNEIIPEIRTNVLYGTLAIGFVLMLVLPLKNFETLTIPQYPAWTFVFRFILDAAFIQSVSYAVLFYLAYKYFSRVSPLHGGHLFIRLLGLFVVIMAMQLLVEGVIKTWFHYDRPSVQLSEGWFTNFAIRAVNWVLGLFGLDFDLGSDVAGATPSGFAVRQTVILLFFMLLAHQEQFKDKFPRTRPIWYVLQLVFFFAVLSQRVYLNRHTLFDIGIGIGIATILFWFFVVCLTFLFRRSEINKKYIGTFIAPLGAYSIAIYFYSQETRWFMLSTLAMVLFLAGLYNLRVTPQPRPTGGKELSP